MGGFAGGDEGGYWDEDYVAPLVNNKSKKKNKVSLIKDGLVSSIKAYAKINIFFKITGFREDKPTFISRVVRVEDMYDTISFVPCKCDTFTIEGCDEISLESNSIYKAYKEICDYTNDSDIEDFFYENKVVVTKRISHGLGASSSNAASFMHLLKEVCNLILSTKELIKIGQNIGTYVPFFLYNYSSANVSGCGEVVEYFEEEVIPINVYTPSIKCMKNVVIQKYKEQTLTKDIRDTDTLSLNWTELSSKKILESISDPFLLNDLYSPTLLICPKLKKEYKESWFFSGSNFFKY